MYNLPLWSWWSLGLILGGWFTWLMLALPLYIKFEKGLRWFLLSTFSGFLLAVGFPISPLTPLMFVAFIPLMILLEEILQSDEPNKKRLVLRYSYNTFVLWNILSTFWVGNAGLIPGLIANFLNAFFMCLPIVAYFITKKRLGENIGFLALICYWFTWEWVHLNWDLSWAWLTIGNAFANQINWIQWYEYTGVFGGGFWILLLNILMYKILKINKFSFKNIFIPYKKQWLFVAALLVIPIVFSLYLKEINQYALSKTGAEIVALQANYEPHYEKFEVSDDLQLERYLQLAKANITQNTDYLILPETAFGTYDIDELEEYKPVKAFKLLADSFPNLHIISGFDLVQTVVPAENPPISVRHSGNRFYEIYNGAVQIAHNQSLIPIYKKGKFVPGAEILPFSFLFKGLQPLFKKMGGTVEGLGTQAERSLFWNEKGVGIAPVICYESIYGDYCGDYVRHGAQALFIMTNDGWWDDTPGYKQHLAFARLRAIELRKYVVRAANTGSCAVIDDLGNVEQMTDYNKVTAIKGRILLNTHITFYAKYGDFIAKIAIFIAILLGIFTFYKKIMYAN
jgi:apolipoprotein N-acyltransferase